MTGLAVPPGRTQLPDKARAELDETLRRQNLRLANEGRQWRPITRTFPRADSDQVRRLLAESWPCCA